MSVKTSSLFGATTYVDSDYPHRIYDAMGENVRKWALRAGLPCDDSTAVPTEFVVTTTGTSPLTAGVAIGYPLLATTGGTEYDGINAQLRGATAKFVTGKSAFLRGKVILDEATVNDFLFGLCELKTDLLKTGTAHGLNTNVEGAFFYKVAASTVLYAKVYKDGSETFSAVVDTADTNVHDLEVVWDGTSVIFYIDGAEITSFAGTMPDGVLTPSFNLRAGSGAARTASFAGLWYVAVA